MATGSKPRGFKAPPGFTFRTPLLPLSEYLDWGANLAAPGATAGDALTEAIARDTAQLRTRLRALIDRPEIRDALFIASPETHDNIEQWLSDPDGARGQKLERTLVRYFSRMTGRCTPFGLFSGVSAGRLGDRTRLEVGPRERYQRHTRLDNDYLFAVSTALGADPHLRQALRYRPNSSLYEVAGHMRYAEARLADKQRSYHLVAVEPTDYLRASLDRAQAGATRGALAQALVDDDPENTLEDAEAFIDELIESQILVHDLTPAVTGPEPIHGIVDLLRSTGVGAPAADRLSGAQTAINEIDAAGVGTDHRRYRAIADALAPLPAKVELSRLFQVDMVKPAPDATLGPEVMREIERAIETLRKMSPAPADQFQSFKDQFNERYEGREVPLVEVLDEEVGIGFSSGDTRGADWSPLIADLPFPAAGGGGGAGGGGRNWGAREAYLLTRVHEVVATGKKVLELTQKDVERLSYDTTAELPDGFATMCTVIASSPEEMARGRFQIEIEGAYGPSGVRLLGRFCHASDEIHAQVVDHVRAEEALDPGAVFAEIAHLPEGRIGNILCRPVLRDHEIVFLGLSGAARDHQIPIGDLMVSVVGGRVQLRSRALDKVVIPRLSTAHNFGMRSLGIYRFLCTLQAQGSGSAGWGWGSLDDAPFLPRVTFGKLVFARARWLLRSWDLEPVGEAMSGLKQAVTADKLRDLRSRVFAAVRALRERLGLPRYVVLADGDNELPVDFDNVLSVDSFAQMVKSRGSAILIEDFPDASQLCARGPEGLFRNEVVVSLIRDREPTVRRASARPAVSAVPRRFMPPSEWMFVKLYTGTATADEILTTAVAPVVREAIASGAADRWHFIRYGDPQWHIRLRFHGDPRRLRGDILPALWAAAEPLEDRGQIWRMQLDTYEREVERYGGPVGIALAEELFWIDSDAVLEIVEMLSGDEGADARWRLTVRGADMLLDDLGLDLADKLKVMTSARESMGREFRVNTPFQKQLGVKFRGERERLDPILVRDAARDAEHAFAPGFQVLDRRSQRLRELGQRLRARERAGELNQPLNDIVWSYVHMHANRLLRAAARAQELVIYDFLKRHYESIKAQAGRRT